MRSSCLLVAILLGVAPIAAAAAGRFAAANAALAAPGPGERRIVFIGDSITSGWPRYGAALFADKSRIGRGIAGQTTAQMRARFAADVIALRPAIVHILAGTNDIAGNGGPMTAAQTQANLAAMAAAAKAAGARVILGAVLPAADYPWRPGQQPAAKIVALNAWLQREAAANGHVFADYHTPMATIDGALRTEYSKDGVHPSDAGYRAMAPIAEAAIAAAGRR